MTTRRKRSPTHTIFIELAERVEDEGVKATLINDWAYNRFQKDVRYISTGVLIVRGKTTKSYDMTQLDQDEQIKVVLSILKESPSSKKGSVVDAAKTVSTKKPPADFVSLNRMTKNKLIKQYVATLEWIPEGKRSIYRDTIHTGLLIRSIHPEKDIRMVDGAITSVTGIEYDKDTGRISLSGIDGKRDMDLSDINSDED